MIYFCDYTKHAQEAMAKYGLTNDDIQEIFNQGISETQTTKTLMKDNHKLGIFYRYDGYTLRYVILSVYRRPVGSRRE